jgi:hypothetical protein
MVGRIAAHNHLNQPNLGRVDVIMVLTTLMTETDRKEQNGQEKPRCQYDLEHGRGDTS